MYGATIEIVHVQRRHVLDTGLAEVFQLLGGDLVIRRSQQFAGLGVDDVGGQDAADRIVVRHFQRSDVFGCELTHVTRSDTLAGFHQHLAARSPMSKLSVSPRRRSATSSSVAPFLPR